MTTVAEFARHWPFRGFERPAPSTNEALVRNIAPFVKTYGDRELGDVDRWAARSWGMKHRGSIRYARVFYADAISVDLVRENPFAGLKISAPPRRQREIPTMDEAMELAEAATEPLASMIRFAAWTGLRVGEQLALTGADIELDGDHGLVTVSLQLDRRGRLRAPKTPASADTCLIPPGALPIPSVEPSERLWVVQHRTLTQWWHDLQRAQGREELFHWHGLRSSCATHFLDLGASPSDVAQQLRHGDNGEMVMRVYGQPDRKIALNRLKDLLG